MGGGVDTRDATRMEKNELVDEVLRLRALDVGSRGREMTRMKERVKRLELRDQERAREIMRARAVVATLERNLERETAARVAAERNAAGFHALLLQERVRKL